MKALIIVDVQPAFVRKENAAVVANIGKLIRETSYDLYIESVFHAEAGSLWEKQTGWICPRDENSVTLPSVLEALRDKEVVHIDKETKSVFKGTPAVLPLLKQRNIEEVHIVGFDTEDCVLATAYESFDLGFFTYVLENCVQSGSSGQLHEFALALLRHGSLTNLSETEIVKNVAPRSRSREPGF